MLALEYNVRCFAPPLPNHKSTIPRIRTARARGHGQGQGQPSFSSCGFGLGLVWVCLICWMDWTVGWGVGVLRYFTTLALLLPPYSLLCTPKMVFPLEYVCIHVYPLQGRKSCIIQYLVGYPCVFHM